MYGESVTVIQLLYTRAAVDHGSFSKAAAALGVTQPALSNGVAALERSIGGSLFERSRTGAVLTPLGSRVFPHLLRALGAVESIAAEVRAGTETADPLRVGVSPLIHPRVIARALEAASRHGFGSLVLREDDMAPLRAGLAAGRLDLIVVPVVPGASRFARRTLDWEPLHYLPAGTADATDNVPVDVTDLAAHPLLMVGDSCGLTTVTEALLASANQPLIRYPGEADSYDTLQDWAALGLGGVLLPESKFRSGAHHQPVSRDGHEAVISYEAMWDANAPGNGTVDALLDLLA